MPRFWKASAAVVALVLLFFLESSLYVPKPLWVIAFVIVLTYGVSLSLNAGMLIYRRWSIAYLVFVGLSYLLAGLFGVLPYGGLIASSVWYSLISPYPMFTLLKGCIYSYPCSIYKLSYTIFPPSNPDMKFFSIAVIIVSLIAIVAAFAMAKNKKAAYNVWLGLVCLSILSTLGYVIAEFARWGMIQYTGSSNPRGTIVSLCWSVSYVAAYLMARKGADVRKVNAP